MRTKAEIDRDVALATGVPLRKVENITSAFVDELCNAIAQHGGFHVTRLGTLTPKIERGSSNILEFPGQEPMRVKLYFRKSRLLKEQIDRHLGLKEMGNGKR